MAAILQVSPFDPTYRGGDWFTVVMLGVAVLIVVLAALALAVGIARLAWKTRHERRARAVAEGVREAEVKRDLARPGSGRTGGRALGRPGR